MTVDELVEELKKFDGDMEIIIRHEICYGKYKLDIVSGIYSAKGKLLEINLIGEEKIPDEFD